MTAISVIVAYFVATLEIFSLVVQELHLNGSLWGVFSIFDSGNWSLAFGVGIIGTFILCWIFSILFYKYKISNSIVPQQTKNAEL